MPLFEFSDDYGESVANCLCCKTFRTSPEDIELRARYDNKVRQAVVDRILVDKLNTATVQRAIKRDKHGRSPRANSTSNAGKEETVFFIGNQFREGHPEVLWWALPESVQEALDSEEFRIALGKEMRSELAKSVRTQSTSLMRIVEVFVTKKRMVLRSNWVKELPREQVSVLNQAYDPTVGLIYESLLVPFNLNVDAETSTSDWVNRYGPRIGGHARKLFAIMPQRFFDNYKEKFVIKEEGGTGTLRVPMGKGKTSLIKMVRFEERWVPADIAEALKENERRLAAVFSKQISIRPENAEEKLKSLNFSVAFMDGFIARGVDPMLKARTQKEFDKAFANALLAFNALSLFSFPSK